MGANDLLPLPTMRKSSFFSMISQPEGQFVEEEAADMPTREYHATSENGCKTKREAKLLSKQKSQKASSDNNGEVKAENGDDFGQYHARTLQKIQELREQIKVCSDKKQTKRLKNMISAYKSRLHKRSDVE